MAEETRFELRVETLGLDQVDRLVKALSSLQYMADRVARSLAIIPKAMPVNVPKYIAELRKEMDAMVRTLRDYIGAPIPRMMETIHRSLMRVPVAEQAKEWETTFRGMYSTMVRYFKEMGSLPVTKYVPTKQLSDVLAEIPLHVDKMKEESLRAFVGFRGNLEMMADDLARISPAWEAQMERFGEAFSRMREQVEEEVEKEGEAEGRFIEGTKKKDREIGRAAKWSRIFATIGRGVRRLGFDIGFTGWTLTLGAIWIQRFFKSTLGVLIGLTKELAKFDDALSTIAIGMYYAAEQAGETSDEYMLMSEAFDTLREQGPEIMAYWARFQAVITSFKVLIVSKFLPVLTDFLAKLVEVFSDPRVLEAIVKLGTALTENLVDIIPQLVDSFIALLPVIELFVDVLTDVLRWLGPLIPALFILGNIMVMVGPIISMVATALNVLSMALGLQAAAASSSVVASSAFLSTLVSFLPVLAVVAAAVVAFALAYKHNWFGVRDATNKAIDEIMKTLHAWWEGLQWFYGVTKPLWDLLGAVVVSVIRWMVGWFTAIIQLLRGDFPGAARTMQETVVDIFEGLRTPISNFKTWFVDGVYSISTSVAAAALSWRDNIWSSLENIGEVIVNFFTELPEKAYEWGINLIQSFVQGITDNITGLGDALVNVGESIQNFLGSASPPKMGPLKEITNWGSGLLNEYVKGIEKMIPTLRTRLEMLPEIPTYTSPVVGGPTYVTQHIPVEIVMEGVEFASREEMEYFLDLVERRMGRLVRWRTW